MNSPAIIPIVAIDRGEIIHGVAKPFQTELTRSSGVTNVMYLYIDPEKVPVDGVSPVVTESGIKIWKLHKNCLEYKPSTKIQREERIKKLVAGELIS